MKLASQQFQQELSNTQARGAEAISDPVDTEKGLQALKALVEEKSDKVDDEYVMEMDEIKAALLEHDIDMDEADDLDDAAEEEMEEASMAKEDVASMVETTVELETERGRGTEELAKQQGPRKRFFKPTENAVGSSKMRIANALVKRAAAKASTRQGDGRKQQECKGASTLKSGNFKNGLVGLYWYVSLIGLVAGVVESWAGRAGTFSCFNMGDRFSLVPMGFLGDGNGFMGNNLVQVVGGAGGKSLKFVPRFLGNIFWIGGVGF
ncbi:hypothetical protein DY000_02059127 [Brassica cretica]|uniref:Uncharacterized protein n=1 Tax=Brassica cretica TaxID=69181 RepID=A0ABQ7AZW4_BRACR|nr:hypothetical protein DY000_02059127 [Brassica cretica]